MKINENKKHLNKPRILIAISAYYPIIGGAERQAQLFAETYIKLGYSVQVVTKLRSPDHAAEEFINGVKVTRNGNRIKGSLIEIFKKRNEFDVLFYIGQYRETNKQLIFGLIVKYILKKKVIFRSTDLVEFYRNDMFKSSLTKWIIRQYDLVLTTNEPLYELFTKEIGTSEKITIRPYFNFIDNDQFKPIDKTLINIKRAESGVPESKKVLCYVGRLEPRKGVIQLLEAFKQLRDEYFLILVCGSYKKPDPDLENTRQKVSEFSSQEVKILMNYHKPYELMQISDACVFPSIAEPKGNTLIESLLCGTPCIVSNIETFYETIPAELQRYMFDPTNPGSIAAKITQYFEENKTTNSQLLRAFALKDYSKEALIKKYDMVLERLGY